MLTTFISGGAANADLSSCPPDAGKFGAYGADIFRVVAYYALKLY